MYCKNCGEKLENNAKFCGKCGCKVGEVEEIVEEVEEIVEEVETIEQEEKKIVSLASNTTIYGLISCFMLFSMIIIFFFSYIYN